jgi:hypothetical protein
MNARFRFPSFFPNKNKKKKKKKKSRRPWRIAKGEEEEEELTLPREFMVRSSCAQHTNVQTLDDRYRIVSQKAVNLCPLYM